MSMFRPRQATLPAPPPPVPATPTATDASLVNTGNPQGAAVEPQGLGSLVTTGPTGLKQRANTNRRSLIGAT